MGDVKKWVDGKAISLGKCVVLQCEYGFSYQRTQCTAPSWINFKQLWYIDGTHCVSLIHGLPKRILYYVISPLITCSNVCIVFCSYNDG